MYVKDLRGGGEIRLRPLGEGWTLSVVAETAKGVAVGLTLDEGTELAKLLLFEDAGGFEECDTGVIRLADIDGEQHEKEDTDD